MTAPRERARRVLKQRIELERALGADVLPRRRAAKPAAAAAACDSGTPPPRSGADVPRAGRPQPAAPALPPRAPGAGPHPAPAVPPSPFPRRPAAPPPPRDPAAGLPDDLRAKFLALREEALACVKCGLHKTRTHVVFGVGSPVSPLMFVGEAPGADEDAQGEPFVGRAGQLLTKTLADLGIRRETVYIGNILKCRPPENRKPEPDEVSMCFPYLRRQVEIIRPKVLCALGAVAAQALLGNAESISRIRGRYHDFPWIRGLRVFPTFHPAYLLRSPWELPKFKQDLRQILADLRLMPA